VSHFGYSKSHAPIGVTRCQSLPGFRWDWIRQVLHQVKSPANLRTTWPESVDQRGLLGAQGFFKTRWSGCYQVGSHWFHHHQIRNRFTMIHRLKLQMVQRQSRGMRQNRQNRQNVAAVVMLRPMVLPILGFCYGNLWNMSLRPGTWNKSTGHIGQTGWIWNLVGNQTPTRGHTWWGLDS